MSDTEIDGMVPRREGLCWLGACAHDFDLVDQAAAYLFHAQAVQVCQLLRLAGSFWADYLHGVVFSRNGYFCRRNVCQRFANVSGKNSEPESISYRIFCRVSDFLVAHNECFL
jgi:hypothetical protein